MSFSNERLKEFRKENSLSQNGLVMKLHHFAEETLSLDYSITVETVRNWENNRAVPSGTHLEVLQSYAYSVGYNPLYFFSTFTPKNN